MLPVLIQLLQRETSSHFQWLKLGVLNTLGWLPKTLWALPTPWHSHQTGSCNSSSSFSVLAQNSLMNLPSLFALRMMEIFSLFLLPSCFPWGNGACDVGKRAVFLWIISGWQTKHCVEALNQQCIWACFSKAMPKNEQKRCRDILASTRGGNPEKAHSHSSEKVQKIHKIFHKHL